MTDGYSVPANKCGDYSYYHSRHKKCFPCSNICTSKLLSVSDECKESCPNWSPQPMSTTPTAGHYFESVNNEIVVIAAAVILGLVVLALLALFLYRWRKHRKPSARAMDLCTTVAVQETTQVRYLPEKEQLLTDEVGVTSQNMSIVHIGNEDGQFLQQDETSVKMAEVFQDIHMDH